MTVVPKCLLTFCLAVPHIYRLTGLPAWERYLYASPLILGGLLQTIYNSVNLLLRKFLPIFQVSAARSLLVSRESDYCLCFQS